ncbi:ATP-binding protein [Pseudoxanthomonas composti]|uniref:histidine kinase n=1 Tax=Pseudoxanthomonas composti TaxID=2137479 RepID=A0A4V1N164_9GAMM|nr:ATP-binding protein [Pseudoxanthomonas composti]RXR06174.1 HAMP domain-containing protein [Pseudoxanthomonas composti]
MARAPAVAGQGRWGLRLLPASVFGQLVLVIALVLVGAGLLTLLLGRELAARPAAEQLLRAIDGFAHLVEQADAERPHAQVLRRLHEAGLQTASAPPADASPRIAPFLRRLLEQDARLGTGRELRLQRSDDSSVLWLKLNTEPTTWVAFHGRRDGGLRHFTLGLLIGSVVLVWAAAAYFARRLVVPLRGLARAAPGIVRGEGAPPATTRAPREVADLARALGQASDEVRAAAAERAFMLAGISHDLRTPLTRVQFAVALLPHTDPQLRQDIERDIGEIDAILSQFIAYARDGRDEAAESLDLADLCRSVIAASHQPWAVTLPATAPLQGRPMALARAIENLVVNAERHAAAPFALSLTAQGADWVLRVSDHGPGLSPEAADRALRPFVHDPSRGGSGLGLAIVERVARQHGGQLLLTSNTPHGLCAVMTLPGA